MSKIRCCFCSKLLDEVYSNNALPVQNGRCCGDCNWSIVIPKRLESLK